MPSVAERQPMFAYLVTAVVVAGGTWLIYRHFFDSEENNDDYEEPPTVPSLSRAESDEIGFPVRIFYGSQSGTAEGFGFDMKKDMKKLGFGARVIDLEEYDPDDLSQELAVIFLVATYGEGEPTDNAQDFYEWLCDESRAEDELEGISFAVFGLGNSQYEFFNEMSKQFDERLERMGATRLIERGSGDDDTGEIEEQFSEWLKVLYPKACEEFLNCTMDMTEQEFKPSLQYTIVEDEEIIQVAKSITFPFCGENVGRQFRPEKRHKWMDSLRLSTMVVKKEARINTTDGSTLHMEFDVSDLRNFRYHTAHNFGIVPRNDYKRAAMLCKRLNIHPEAVLELSRVEDDDDTPMPVPRVVRARDLFVWYCDINAYPRKGMLTVLKDLATDPEEAKEIEDLLNLHHGHDGPAVCRSFDGLLNRYESIEIDLPTALELLRPMQPRLFTISSSAKAQPGAVSITAKIERGYQAAAAGEEEFFGVCSRHLFGLGEGDKCQVYIQESHFDLPAKQIPVIMIGPGTGLAPFRAFIQERTYLMEETEYGDCAPWYLYYGCRWSDVDYIYKEELEQAADSGVLTKLRVAFSRENPDKKVYVQDLIAEDGDELWDLISNHRARVFICGATSMGSGVRGVLRSVIAANESVSEEEAEKVLADLLSKKQLIQELWGS